MAAASIDFKERRVAERLKIKMGDFHLRHKLLVRKDLSCYYYSSKEGVHVGIEESRSFGR